MNNVAKVAQILATFAVSFILVYDKQWHGLFFFLGLAIPIMALSWAKKK